MAKLVDLCVTAAVIFFKLIATNVTCTVNNSTVLLHVSRNLWYGDSLRMSIAYLETAGSPANIDITIRSSDQRFNLQRLFEISTGENRIVSFNETANIINKDMQLYLNVKVYDAVTNKLIFQRDFKIWHRQVQPSFYIQTDKLTYRQGDTVRYRGLVLNHNQRPYGGPIRIDIKDPNNNGNMEEKGANIRNGVINKEFKLPKNAAIGKYYIEIGKKNEEDLESKFTVGEKVCVNVINKKKPELKIIIKSIDFQNDTDLLGELIASLPNGDPFVGIATIQLSAFKFTEKGIQEVSFTDVYENFNGRRSFIVSSNIINNFRCEYCGVTTLTANISDSLGEQTLATTQQAVGAVYNRRRYFTKVYSMEPRTISPGRLYSVQIIITDEDGAVTSDLPVILHLQYKDSVAGNTVTAERRYNATTNNIGIAEFTILTENAILYDHISMWSNVQDKDTAVCSWYVLVDKSPSDSTINIRVNNTDVVPGEVVQVIVQSNFEINSYQLQILSPRTILDSKLMQSKQFAITITNEMAPLLTLVVTHVKPVEGGVVTDVLKLPVKNAFPNKVTLSVSKKVVAPGDEVTITTSAFPGSTIVVYATIQETNDRLITSGKITHDKERHASVKPGYVSYINWKKGMLQNLTSTAWTNILNAGLLLLTNSNLYKDPTDVIKHLEEKRLQKRQIEFPASVIDAKSAVLSNNKNNIGLWKELFVNENGIAEFNVTAPDVSHTWRIHAFAISPDIGLGITKEAVQLKIVKNFSFYFVVPPKLSEGEILFLEVSIFNYLDQPGTVNLTLSQHQAFSLHEVSSSYKSILVDASGRGQVVFQINFDKLGKVPINITLTTSSGIQSKVKYTKVEAVGISKREVKSRFIKRYRRSKLGIYIPLDLPDDSVRESISYSLYTSKNIVDNILRQFTSDSSGCGAKVLTDFAIGAMQLATMDEMNEKRSQVKQRIRSLYAELLRYQHDDGTFSAFGMADGRGDIQFTASVLKWTLYAKNIDHNLVNLDTLQFTILQIINMFSQPSISFQDRHRTSHDIITLSKCLEALVLHRQELIKNSSSKHPNSRLHALSVTRAIRRVQIYLEKQLLQEISNDVHALSVMTQALMISKSRYRKRALYHLQLSSTETGNLYFWKSKSLKSCKLFERKVSLEDIETTSYALLSMMMNRPVQYLKLNAMVRWLIHNRDVLLNSPLTQDSLIVIEALAQANHLAGGRRNQILDVELMKNYPMSKRRRHSGDVGVVLKGAGTADVQVVVEYKSLIKSRESIIDIQTTTTEIKRDMFTLQICLRLLNNTTCGPELQHGAVVKMGIMHGFEVLESGRNSLYSDGVFGDARLIHVESGVVRVYLRNIGVNSTCIKIPMKQNIKISQLQPQTIEIFEYQNYNTVAFGTYFAPGVFNSTCDCEINCDNCSENSHNEETFYNIGSIDMVGKKLNSIESLNETCFAITGDYEQRMVNVVTDAGSFMYERKYGVCGIQNSTALNRMKAFTFSFNFNNRKIMTNQKRHQILRAKLNDAEISVVKIENSNSLRVELSNPSKLLSCQIITKPFRAGADFTNILLMWDLMSYGRVYVNGVDHGSAMCEQIFNIQSQHVYSFQTAYFHFGKDEMESTDDILYKGAKLWLSLLSNKEIKQLTKIF